MSDFRSTQSWKDASTQIFEQLDRDKIAAEIRAALGKELASWDLETLGEMVFSTAEKWLARDCLWMELDGIESRFEWEGESGIYDMTGRFTDEAPDYLRGKRFVRDWKTSSSSLDDKWVKRYTDSWQWRIYLYNAQADVFVYSGITRGGESREFYLPRPANLEEQVKTQLISMGLMREQLISSGMLVYPMNRPFACNAFGRECENLHDCRNWTMPQQALESWNWSPSSMEQFLICPERMRRAQLRKLAGQELLGGDAAEMGKAFHAGVAELYRQAFGMEKPND